ncbi:hypothetical protein JKP88DRAFT_159682 [Tribonema minus]|uniref:Uncharacterized protein n=1 Tax=Tribonema minus TaxID=303371 RepID=A0A836CN73_9STRA|nr:hypothetical protein JKP88DRAFT_159682 [Tribonema minus]
MHSPNASGTAAAATAAPLTVTQCACSLAPLHHCLSLFAAVKGYYDQTWQQRAAPSGTNLGVAFGGWADVDQALADAQQVYNNLVGSKYLDIGGGDSNGRWTSNSITKLNNGLGKIKSAGYVGVCYDIEEGDAGLSTAFANSFAKAKAAGLKVLVTISHSQPYGFSDAATIMNTMFASASVDYVSPQLYTSGGETANDWTVDGGAIGWRSYASSKGKIVPSVVKASMYANAQSTFQSYGVTTAGYITWA